MKELNILYFCSFPPQPCGIACFAKEMAKAISKADPKIKWKVIAVVPPNQKFKYPREVIMKVQKENLKDYQKAGEFFNKSPFNLAIIHHEFNIYGGKNGEYLIHFLKTIKKPAIGIMHSLPNPQGKLDKKKKELITLLKKLSLFFKKMVVMCEIGKKRLQKICKNSSKIKIIPHGSISFPKISCFEAKKRLGLEKNIVILIFGFITPHKGYEEALKAFSEIHPLYPQAKLIFLGGPHPLHPAKNYLKEFKLFIKKLNLEENVVFVKKLFPLKELINYLKIPDLILLPYQTKEQVSSGTLTNAITTGNCVISTPFIYAKEMLREKRRFFIEFENVNSICSVISYLIQNPQEIEKTRKKPGNLEEISLGKR